MYCRVVADGHIELFSADEIAHAKLEPVPHARKKMPMIAPHAADDAMAGTPNAREIRLTIDGSLQLGQEMKLVRPINSRTAALYALGGLKEVLHDTLRSSETD